MWTLVFFVFLLPFLLSIGLLCMPIVLELDSDRQFFRMGLAGICGVQILWPEYKPRTYLFFRNHIKAIRPIPRMERPVRERAYPQRAWHFEPDYFQVYKSVTVKYFRLNVDTGMWVLNLGILPWMLALNYNQGFRMEVNQENKFQLECKISVIPLYMAWVMLRHGKWSRY